MPPPPAEIDLLGAVLSVVGLGLFVFGVLRSSEWGWVIPSRGHRCLFGTSTRDLAIVGGLLSAAVFLLWEVHLERTGGEPLVPPAILRVSAAAGRADACSASNSSSRPGIFFAIPLFLSVSSAVGALTTGVRLCRCRSRCW